jgi:hypothetical protein
MNLKGILLPFSAHLEWDEEAVDDPNNQVRVGHIDVPVP